MSDSRIKNVAFGDEKTRQAFNALKQGRFEEKQLSEYIDRAISDLKENSFAGVKIPRNVWPKYYAQRFSINNLRKYDLPNGWRLIYTIRGNTVEIVAVILEWFDHKDYEKRFGY